MSKAVKSVGKVFKKVGNAVKKIVKSKAFKVIAIAAAVLFTGGMAIGAFGTAGLSASIASGISSIPLVGSTAASVFTAGSSVGSAIAGTVSSALSSTTSAASGSSTGASAAATGAAEAGAAGISSATPLSAGLDGLAGDAASAFSQSSAMGMQPATAASSMPGVSGLDGLAGDARSAFSQTNAMNSVGNQDFLSRASSWWKGLDGPTKQIIGQAGMQGAQGLLNGYMVAQREEEQRRMMDEERQRRESWRPVALRDMGGYVTPKTTEEEAPAPKYGAPDYTEKYRTPEYQPTQTARSAGILRGAM